jgi:hypothetical protein
MFALFWLMTSDEKDKITLLSLQYETIVPLRPPLIVDNTGLAERGTSLGHEMRRWWFEDQLH